MDNYLSHTALKAELILSELGSLPGPLTILEIGCSNGLLAHFVARASDAYTVCATDTDEELIEIAAQEYKNVSFFSCPSFLEEMTGRPPSFLKPHLFDCIYFAESLHHMDEATRRQQLKESAQLLKESGKLLILELNPAHEKTRKAFSENPQEVGLSMLSINYLTDVLNDSHFSVTVKGFKQPVYLLSCSLKKQFSF